MAINPNVAKLREAQTALAEAVNTSPIIDVNMMVDGGQGSVQIIAEADNSRMMAEAAAAEAQRAIDAEILYNRNLQANLEAEANARAAAEAAAAARAAQQAIIDAANAKAIAEAQSKFDAEQLRIQQEALAARQRSLDEAAAKASIEQARLRQQAIDDAAAAERLRQYIEQQRLQQKAEQDAKIAAEQTRLRLEAEAQAEAARIRADADRRKQEEMAAIERQRQIDAELAAAVERQRQANISAEAAAKMQAEVERLAREAELTRQANIAIRQEQDRIQAERDSKLALDRQRTLDAAAAEAERRRLQAKEAADKKAAADAAAAELARLEAAALAERNRQEQERQAAQLAYDNILAAKAAQERVVSEYQDSVVRYVADLRANATPPALPNTLRLTYTVKATIYVLPQSISKGYQVFARIKPPVPVLEIGGGSEVSTIKLINIPLPVESTITEELDRLIADKVENFYDQDRELKTLLNFGTDYQPLVVNWKYDETDSSGQGMILKLHNPLPAEVLPLTPVFVSRELSYPTLEKIFILEAPAPIPNVYLRYPNKRIRVSGRTGGVVNNVTLNTLLSSGAFDPVKPQDPVMEEWFTTALEGAELNIDYSNYFNFIFYGSAEKRLEAFKNKLLLVENYDAAIAHNSSSMSITGSVGFTSSLVYNSLYKLSQDRQDIIRSFDGYERFLYYGSGSAMSGSFTKETDRTEFDGFYYYADATWPKISGVVAPVASASAWYDGLAEIAQIYDVQNVNRFVNNLPEYIQNDTNSEAFMRFFDLAGHMFDTVKLYIDQMSNIYDRNSDPSEGLSPDLVWDIANAFGIVLPNQYAIESLLDYTLGNSSSKVYRQVATETWRRFLHNQIFLMKSKGTKTALRALLNTYGVLPTTIQIRESSTPSYFYASQSYEIYEEQTNALQFAAPSSSYVTVPWSSSVGNEPVSVQVRFSTAGSTQTQILLNADNTWAVVLAPTGSSYQIQLMSGSTVTARTLAWPLGTGDYYSLMLVYASGSSVKMYLKRADEDGDIVVSDTVTDSESTGSMAVWDMPTNLYVGGSGSYGSGYRGLVGTIDEFRIWGETTTEETFTNWVKYPGMYNGNTPNSAVSSSLVRLSFNDPNNLGQPGTQSFVPNDSPYQRLSFAPANMTHFSASGFSHISDYPYNTVVYTRTVQRFSPTGGGSQFDTNKIIIVDAPVLQYMSGSSVPVLHKNSSIVPLETKDENTKANNIVGFYFSPTQAINDSIIRSIGNIDLNDYIADPLYLSSERYKSLDDLNKFYWSYYAYPINTNSFITFVQNLLSPLFEQARRLVPSRAKLMAGVVIEPHILERNKMAWKPIIKEESDLDVVDTLTSNPAVEAATEDNDAIFDLTIGEVGAEMADNQAIYDMTQGTIAAETNDNDASISLDFGTITDEITDYDDTIDAYHICFETLNAITLDYDSLYDIHQILEDAVRVYSTLPYVSPYQPTYGAASDLESDVGATNYFDNLAGLIGTKKFTYTRVRANVLTDKGNWTFGATYRKNDVVVQPYSVTDSRYDLGNGKEFYAIMDNFISNIPPQGDTSHWRRVAYVASQVMDIKKAVLINGELSLVPTGSSYAPVNGYLPQHYKYFQPNYTAFRRSRYVGCVQSDVTTSDAKPAVEVLLSAADTLVVSTTGEPIISPDNLGGQSFLDVK